MPKLELEPKDDGEDAVAIEATAYFQKELTSIENRVKIGESDADLARNEERAGTLRGIIKDLEVKDFRFAKTELQEETDIHNGHSQDSPENKTKLELLKKIQEC